MRARVAIADREGAKWARVAAVGVVLFSASSEAQVKPRPVDLTWSAPAECPALGAVTSELARLVPSSTRRTLRATGVVSRKGDGSYALQLAILGADTRDFSAPTCTELASTAAVVLALAVDPTRATPEAAPPPPPPPPLPVPEATPPIPLLPPEPSPTPQSFPPALGAPREKEPDAHPGSIRLPPLFGSIGARATWGELASPTFGLVAGVGWSPRHARVDLSFLWYPTTEILGPVPNTGGAFGLVGASVDGCWLPLERGRFALGPCGGIEVGDLSAQANGGVVTQSNPSSSVWAAAALGAIATYRLLPHLRAKAEVWGLAPITRHDFVITHVDTVHTAGPVAAAVGLGIEASLFP